jgi:receptor protein-tyrosine kinase
MLHDVGADLLGAVLSMMPTRGSGAYSYNYYYYGGSYGDGTNKLTETQSESNIAADLGTSPSGKFGREQAS